MRNSIKHITSVMLPIICAIMVLASCNVTKNLPEGETLYIGMKKTEIADNDNSEGAKLALNEVNASLEKKPNGAIFGPIRNPWPIRLCIYNDFINAKTKFGKWIFNKFASEPVLVNAVNPEMRSKIATNLLKDYGYFNGEVKHEIIYSKKNDKKAFVKYYVNMGKGYSIDTVYYGHFNNFADSIIDKNMKKRLLHKGDPFSVVTLDAERQRISSLLRNNGYYYFKPDYLSLLADTLISPGKVTLKIEPKTGISDFVKKRWTVGDTEVFLHGYDNENPTKTRKYKDLTIHYEGKLRIRPKVLYTRLRDKKGDFYSQAKHTGSQSELSRLGVFRYVDIQYSPQDSMKNILKRTLNTAYDYPLDGELEFNFKMKSNDYIGPGASFSVAKKNIFHGGERLSVSLKGAYEWQTNARQAGTAINSYEFGADATLDFQTIVFPGVRITNFKRPVSSQFRLYANQLNRAQYFKLLDIGGSAEYKFRPNNYILYTIKAFELNYNLLQKTTSRFDSIRDENPALYLSLKDQFIPSMGFTFNYDNESLKRRYHTWWEVSFTSAGNILSCAYAAFGQKFSKKDKDLLGNPFSQFAKISSDVRYTYKLGEKHSIATRFALGIGYAYGNSYVIPYSEQFYVGGANSIRAFTIRSIGPGSYRSKESKYSYIDQNGDLKIEANIEYRFNIWGGLNGAVFLDAGNVWLTRDDPARPGGVFRFKSFAKEIALGTGVGLRYDLSFIVVRFDVGFGLHTPYETCKKGYYNIEKFGNAIGYHFAIGYPF